MSEHSEQPTDNSKKIRARAGLALTIIAGIVAVLAGIAQVAQFIEDHKPKTERFEANLMSKTAAVDFASFLQRNDSKVVYLNIECVHFGEHDDEWPESLSKDSRCFARYGFQYGDTPPNSRWLLATEDLTAYEVWYTSPSGPEDRDARERTMTIFDIEIPDDSDAREFNGPKGAGWRVTKGYFSVTRTTFGDAPQLATHYVLRGVNSSQVQR